MSVTVMGQKLAMPVYCSPTALQRLFHHRGRARRSRGGREIRHDVRRLLARHGQPGGAAQAHNTPQVYQFYFHKDRGLNRAMLERAKAAGVEVMMLTVDSITGGNRERDLRTGFSIPFRLTLAGMMQFAIKPKWALDYLTHEKFSLPQLDDHVDMGGGTLSIGRYFTEMLDPSMSWKDVEEMVQLWDGQFCLKGHHERSRTPRRPSTSAAAASSSPIMAAGSWTARAAPSISWPRSSTPSATRSMC